MSDEAIDNIKAISKAQVAEKKYKVIPANQDYFEALMKQGQRPDELQKNQAQAPGTPATAQVEDTQKPTLLDEVSKANNRTDPVGKVSPSQLIAQSQETIEKINRVKEVLATPNLDIKNSFHSLLKNKLSHIDENLKIALSKAGAEYTSQGAPEAQGLMNPIERYMGYLTHSQDQLVNLSSQVESMGAGMTPANMLAIQIKVGYIQQELEFFTSLLNKALESTKTLMNVQV